MPILSELVLATYSPPQTLDRNAVRRRKLIEKIDEQIKIATDPSFIPTRWTWVTDGDGSKRVEVPKRLKRWWAKSATGTTHLTIRYGSKVLALSKDGKNAIQCSEADVASVLAKVKDAVAHGELDEQLDKISQYGSRVQFKRRVGTSAVS